jgi:HK97 family phage portal protein
MNILQKAAVRLLVPKESRDQVTAIGGISQYLQWLQKNMGKTLAGVNVTEESALTLSYAWSAINVLAQTTAHIPLHLMERTDKGNKPAYNHPLFDLVHSQPHENYTSFTFRETLEAHRNGWGNCYALINRKGIMSPDVESIEILPPKTRPLKLNGSLVYEAEVDGEKRIYPAADILHIHGLGSSGMLGYSPVQVLKESFALGLATLQVGNSFFGSGMQPSLVIETSGQSHNQEEFRKNLQNNFSGIENVGSAMILPKGATAKAISINPEDAQFLQSRQFNRTEIAGIYRVPPHFIGDLDKNTFTNAASMDLNFIKHTMTPIFVRWETELNRKLLTAKERKKYFFQFNVNGILRGSPAERSAYYKDGINGGYLTRNQVRQFEDMPIDDDSLDQYLLPVNMAPVSEADMQPLIESVSYRLSAGAVKAINEGIRKDSLLDSISRHMQAAEAIVTPLSRAMRLEDRFIKQYLEAYRSLINSIDLDKIDVELSNDEILKHFNGVLNEHRKAYHTT